MADNNHNLVTLILSDWKVNRYNTKSLLITTMYRLAFFFRTHNLLLLILGLPYLILYRIFIEWILAVEIPPLTKIGPFLRIFHGQGIVINNRTKIGSNCTLRHGVTIGNKGDDINNDKCPTIGNNVTFGAASIAIGPISIGDNAVIGAGAVVVDDVPPYTVVAGNPAKVIRQLKT